MLLATRGLFSVWRRNVPVLGLLHDQERERVPPKSRANVKIASKCQNREQESKSRAKVKNDRFGCILFPPPSLYYCPGHQIGLSNRFGNTMKETRSTSFKAVSRLILCPIET